MKKLLLLVALIAVFSASAQEKIDTIIYVDGVETMTSEYSVGDYSILDVYVNGILSNSTREKDGIIITGSLSRYKAYGQYVAFSISITNNSSDTFNFLPKQHLIATNTSKGKIFSALTYKEYNKVVKRRQNGSAFLMALSTGMSNAGAGTTYGSTYGNVGGTSYSSRTVVYSPALARLETDRNNANLTNFVSAQANSLLAAKGAYLKANTIAPGQSVAGHILISTRRLSKKFIDTDATIILNGIEFNFQSKIVKGKLYQKNAG